MGFSTVEIRPSVHKKSENVTCYSYTLYAMWKLANLPGSLIYMIEND